LLYRENPYVSEWCTDSEETGNFKWSKWNKFKKKLVKMETCKMPCKNEKRFSEPFAYLGQLRA
jgi:hypothetical protein